MGSAALRRAFERLHGLVDALDGIRLDGKTDPNICREVFQRHSIEWTESAWQALQDEYVDRLAEEAEQRPCGQLCPGLPETLDHLASRPDCVLGLLTGNILRGAEIKLRAFGVWDYFVCGAFGGDREHRPQLVEVALQRAHQKCGRPFAAADAVVIGDTPADIQTARAGGCVSVAVATGRYSTSDLAAHEPDWILDDLADLDRVLRALSLPPRAAVI